MLSGKTPPGGATSKLQLAERTPPPSPRPLRPLARARLRSQAPDLRHPGYYLNRELTWLTFNHRVLHEAEDRRTPLLERVKFLAIVGSNLDEFHMKRIGGLKQQVGAALVERTVDGRTPQRQLEECKAAARELAAQAETARVRLLRTLARKGIRIVPVRALRGAAQRWLRQHYVDDIFPLVTPQAIDPAHPFPFVSNLSLNLLVSARDGEGGTVLSRVKLPLGSGIPRLIAVQGSQTFVMLEDVMAHNLDLLFPGMAIESADLFRVTRNAVAEKDEEQADDLLELIEAELRERKFAPVVRLEVSASMAAVHRRRLAQELELKDTGDLVEVDGMLGLRDLLELHALPRPELLAPAHRPVDHPALAEASNVFEAIRAQGSLLVHHPYHSFASSVERFLREAALDPQVRAIKMTLYRTSEGTRIVDQLVLAARHGKQVTVVVELKARFDEEANIRWASRLEEAGIHVTYGVVGLKTHAKVTLVVRKDADGLRRYVHFGTGNYHAGTARVYTDLGLFTCDEALGRDASELFNDLTTAVNPARRYEKLLVAPRALKAALIARIDREAELSRAGERALIQMKMNALEDPDVVRALYRASRSGVNVDLLVRDTCRLRPGLAGLSENVRVVSIVGRFLEHARMFYFRNGGAEEYLIGSADLMTRNLERRVEALVPVEPPALRAELRHIFDVQLADRRSAWDMQSDGSYQQRTPRRHDGEAGAQERFIALTAVAGERRSRKKGRRSAKGAPRKALRGDARDTVTPRDSVHWLERVLSNGG